jgi:hypothetical protein
MWQSRQWLAYYPAARRAAQLRVGLVKRLAPSYGALVLDVVTNRSQDFWVS